MTIGHYLKSMPQLTNQFTPTNYRNPKRQRLYLKDIDCPDEWARELKEFIPETFFYLNECIEPRTGGDGAILEPNEYGQMKYGKGVAPAGDLMSSLPPEMRALNMMCYIGHEGTYTPAHREMCASLGHNIMVEASQDGNGEKAGSSIWFMTETKEREVVSEYFLSMLGHDIEVEKHFAQINAWKKAPFNVWVVEQKVGDLILIPPLAPHQVWNRGTRTMKAAWNRTTVDTLELALHEALPRARLVCREEQYKNKAIIYYTLIKYHGLLQRDTIEPKMWKYGRIKQLLEDFKRLFALYTEILVSEMFAPNLPTERNVEFLPYDSNVTCSYCRANIFNRFLTCKTCIERAPTGEEDTYDICMECFAMGRSCGCISNFDWVEQWDWSTLTQNYEEWRNVIVQCDGYFDVQKSPQPLEVARKRYGRKPVAQICQEQLKIRPWHDITKPFVPEPSPGESDVEPEADDEGRPKKKTPRRPRKGRVPRVKDKTYACHVCCHHDWNWRLAFCTTCSNAYCYGVLWRGFDLMPQDVMEDRDWSCPKCQGICSCGKCRKTSTQKPYAPKGTLLGHDTRKVADFRSVESLVDFSKTNLGWLREENDHNPQESGRMKRLKEKAEAAKAREDVIDESYLDSHDPQMTIQSEDGNDQIDPQLRDPAASLTLHAHENGHYQSSYPPTDSMNGGSNLPLGAPEAGQSQEPVDDHFDIDFDSYIQPEASYPSRLFAPVAPMHAPEPSDPEPSHLGQNRMMGIGYYQQGNGIDKILYDPPNLDGAADESQNASVSTTANFALSDLLGPQPQEEGTRKRKNGSGSDGDDDTEFFTSKRQKKLAEAKRTSGMNAQESVPDQVEYTPRPPQRSPRRNVRKPQTYTDLGEDSIPISEEDIIKVVPRKPNAGRDVNSDTDLARQAMRRLTRKSASEQEPKRRTRHSQESSIATSRASAKPVRRRSEWLARKEAKEADEDFPNELPRKRGRAIPSVAKERPEVSLNSSKSDGENNSPAEPSRRRGRPPRSATKQKPDTSLVVDISESGGKDDESVIIDSGDSLFGDPEAAKESLEEGITVHISKNKSVERGDLQEESGLGEEEEQLEKPMPRRRSGPSRIDTNVDKPAGPKRLPSLKEKLAQKGKPFKIVAAKSRQSVGSSKGHSSAGSTPPISTALKLPEFSPAADGINTTNTVRPAKPAPEKSLVGSRTPSTETSVTKLNGRAPATAAPVEPVKKTHTIVRLLSPSDQSEEDFSESAKSVTDESSSDDDDDDESIPAVRPARVSRGGGMALRGRGLSNGTSTARRGRGRGRPAIKT
jgi:hypothetical protein